MLQKMYADNTDKHRDSRSLSDHSGGGVRSKKLDFQFYWRALTSKKWPIAIFTALVTAIAIYYAQIATPIYSSNATLLLESQKANIVSIEDLVSSEQESLDYVGTQIALLRSRALAQRVLKQLELQENITQADFAAMLAPSAIDTLVNGVSESIANLTGGVLSSGTTTDNAITDNQEAVQTTVDNMSASDNMSNDEELNQILKKFGDSLRVSPMVKTKLVSIKFESTDPEFSALVANAVATQYIESVLDRRQTIKDLASEWMDERITTLKVKLDESEDALLAFKTDNGLVEIEGGVGRLNEQEILLTSSALAAARNELSSASDIFRKIQAYKSNSPELLDTLPFVQNDALVRSVKTELGQAQRDLNELRNRYGARHPSIIDAESRLETLRSNLDGHIERVTSSFENDFQLIQQRVASLEANIAQGKENIQLIGQKEVTLASLEREVEANRDQYNRMFDRITETRITDGLDEANAVISEFAWVQSNPIKPNKALLVVLAALCSLMLSAFVCFFLEFLDNTVNSTDDVEKRLKTKLVGVLPLVERKFMSKKSLLPLTPDEVSEASETYTEAVNTCRTSLSISGGAEMQVILVTSSVPNEGKSTVALNLAYSYGQMGRTLLIDCDLRRPSIAKALDMPTIISGLSNVLLEKASIKNSIIRNIQDSFDCLASGPVPERPLETLSSNKLARLLTHLREHYETIIIDSAPTHTVSDALVLSKLADSVLYVVKPHSTPIKLVHNGLSRISDACSSHIGVCISQVDVNKAMSHGGLEFHGFGVEYNGYGRYYTYGENPKKRSRAKNKAKSKWRASAARANNAARREEYIDTTLPGGASVTKLEVVDNR